MITPEDLDVLGLVRRMELIPALLLRAEEEQVVSIVPLDANWMDKERERYLKETSLQAILDSKGWTEDDFNLFLWRPEALKRFAKQQFGPGIEERFLAGKENRDEVVYSILRVRDAGLARELWIRLEEDETTFSEAVTQYSEGAEAQRKGVLGPIAIGSLNPPVIGDWLRQMKPGEIRPPEAIGEWHVMVRLEQLTLARFDEAMKKTLLAESLKTFLQSRVDRKTAGENLDPLHYDPS